jgi:hypothetical protein
MRPSRNAKKIWGTTFILLLLGTAVYQLGMHLPQDAAMGLGPCPS